MQQLLAAHDISTRILDMGIACYFGTGSPAALQVHAKYQWAALLILSPIEEEQ